MRLITDKRIKDAIEKQSWNLANDTLYDLCRQHPKHVNDQEIIAKVWFIGRTYMAAIERRRPKQHDHLGDAFYTEVVAPQILKASIDKWLSELKDIKEVNEENLDQILDAHCKLMKLFEKISGLEKRSLASKYLHFHFPNLFFIYDSRATAAIRQLPDMPKYTERSAAPADNEYRKFCEKCLKTRDTLEKKHHKKLTPRQLDNLLIDIADNALSAGAKRRS